MNVAETNSNSMTFAEFMRSALYGPRGYYTTKVRIGKQDADFYTASAFELFGFTLANRLHRVWKQCGSPQRFQVIELGAGQGELMESILSYLAQRHPTMPLEYVVVETSPRLSEIQQVRMEQRRADGVNHFQLRWGQPDAALPSVLIANEVLDALPVERMRRTTDGWQQAHVRVMGDSAHLEWRTAPFELSRLAERWLPIAIGHEAELSTDYHKLIEQVERYGSPLTVLWIDYGITCEELASGLRPFGTVRAYRDHRIVGVLDSPSDNDITADVNWDFVSGLCADMGFELNPLRNQGAFLVENGIVQIAQEIAQQQPQEHWKITAQLKQLVLPGGMGERFSVLECRKG